MPFAGSGLQEGHPLAVTGCRHKGVKPRGSRSLCTSTSSARPVQGEGNSLAVTSQGTCQGAVLMPNSTVKRPLLKAHLFTERERGSKEPEGPIPGWCWQGGRSVLQPGFPEQPGGWHTGSSSRPKGPPRHLGPQPV